MPDKRTKEEIENDRLSNELGDIEKTKYCPMCKSEDVRLVDTGCMCRQVGHSCWSAPHCNTCGYTGAGNSTGGVWIKPSAW